MILLAECLMLTEMLSISTLFFTENITSILLYIKMIKSIYLFKKHVIPEVSSKSMNIDTVDKQRY